MTLRQSSGSATIDVVDADRVHLIRAEYGEMPGLSLTLSQVERLWDLSPDTAETLLWELQRMQFLRRTPKGTYVRADLVSAPRPESREAHTVRNRSTRPSASA
jgi:hypothetical protein